MNSKRCMLIIMTLGMVLDTWGQTWLANGIFGSSDQEVMDNLGISVAVSDSFMIAGAWWEDGEMPGISPVGEAGAAYIYKLQPDGSWAEVQKLISPNREPLGYYGFRVAIHKDFALVGAYNEDHSGAGNAGRVYAYKLDVDGIWKFNDTMLVVNPVNGDYFGYDVALTDGYALIGAPNHDYDENDENLIDEAGAAYLFKRKPDDQWELVTKLVAPDRSEGSYFGKYLDIDRLGIIIGAFRADLGAFPLEAGTAYGGRCNDTLIFWGYDNLTSGDLQKIQESDPDNFDFFGWDVAISGEWAVIGKSNESSPPPGGTGAGTGAAYFFRWENGTWVEKQKVYPSDYQVSGDFGRSIGIDGRICVIGAGTAATDENNQDTTFGAGAAYVFELQNNGQWVEVQKLAGSRRGVNDLFGEAVDVSGVNIVAGAWSADSLPTATMFDCGVLYAWQRDGALEPLGIGTDHIWAGVAMVGNDASGKGIHLKNNDSPFDAGISVYTTDGKKMMGESVRFNNDWQTDMTAFPPGMYLVTITRKGFPPKTWKWLKF